MKWLPVILLFLLAVSCPYIKTTERIHTSDTIIVSDTVIIKDTLIITKIIKGEVIKDSVSDSSRVLYSDFGRAKLTQEFITKRGADSLVSQELNITDSIITVTNTVTTKETVIDKVDRTRKYITAGYSIGPDYKVINVNYGKVHANGLIWSVGLGVNDKINPSINASIGWCF